MLGEQEEIEENLLGEQEEIEENVLGGQEEQQYLGGAGLVRINRIGFWWTGVLNMK